MEKFSLKLKKLKKISIVLMLMFPSALWANLNINHTPIPGGIAVINFNSISKNPKAFYAGIKLYTQQIKKTHWQALVGIPLLTKIGKKYIDIKTTSNQQITFKVTPHNYKEQHIRLTGKKKKYVNPNLKHMDRIKRERPILTKARKTFSTKKHNDKYFIRPTNGIISSPFGLKRFYNDKPRLPHTGLDFTGALDVPILASANGKVIIADNFFFNGNTVFIDHGQGLISVYIHMNKYFVKPNQIVKQGDKIGTIGQTGRATGPHLHFGIYLNQTAINPNLLFNTKHEI